MATQFYNTIFYSGIAGLATIIGILLILLARNYIKKYLIYIASFAAGVLITFALLHLIPDSLEFYDNALIIILIGFLIFYLIEHFVMRHKFHETYYEHKQTVGKTAILGLAFHSLIDGIVIGAGFEISYKIGLIATLVVISHELPEGITSMAVLLHAKVKKSLALLYSFFVAIATPVGALLTYLFLRNINENVLGVLLALAAGSFLYVGASDLVPETHEQYNKINALFMILGVVFVIVIGAIFS